MFKSQKLTGPGRWVFLRCLLILAFVDFINPCTIHKWTFPGDLFCFIKVCCFYNGVTGDRVFSEWKVFCFGMRNLPTITKPPPLQPLCLQLMQTI